MKWKINFMIFLKNCFHESRMHRGSKQARTFFRKTEFYWIYFSLASGRCYKQHFRRNYQVPKILKYLGQEAWSSGYGRRLVFWGSWVRILAQWPFFTYICCKNCNAVCLKRLKINNKRGRGWPIIKIFIKYRCLEKVSAKNRNCSSAIFLTIPNIHYALDWHLGTFIMAYILFYSFIKIVFEISILTTVANLLKDTMSVSHNCSVILFTNL